MGKGPFQFFKTKVAMALIGALLIGGTSAVLAARTVNEPSVLQTSNALTTNSNSTTGSQLPTATTSTAKATATSSPTAVGIPTVPNGPPPTRVPTATPAVGQLETLSGTVTSVGTSSFVLTRNGVPHIIDVNGGTTWNPGQGGATSLSTLQTGMHAQVTGTVQAGGSCLASQVSSNIDN